MKTIAQYPYNNIYSMKTHENIKKLCNEIKEEKQNISPDTNKINRLEEQKLIEGLFSFDQLGQAYGKYRNPG